MAANDREVFKKLVGKEDDRTPINFLTYALFAFERSEWVAHYTRLHNADLDQQAIDDWTANFTDSQFASLTREAAAFFDTAARQYMADEIEQARQETLKSGVLSEVKSAVEVQKSGLNETLAEVKSAGSFSKQLGLQMLTAIIAPLLLGAGFAAILLFTDKMPSPREAASWFSQPAAKINGQ